MANALLAELSERLGAANVRSGALERHSVAHDASHYLLIPEAVVIAENAAAIAKVLAAARHHRTPVTFRAGGTSLSGQASGRGILVDTRRGFRAVEVLDRGARLRVQPGVTLRAANAHLARHGYALGPDPASEVACTVGGVIANNSSGMAAGTEFNSYRTLESLVAVLTSGTIVDSAAADAAECLARTEPKLVATLEALRDRVRASTSATAEIRERFAMKNTMGYSLNAFLDFEEPLDILVHLLVGSEGTLAFIADSVFRTVPVEPEVATGLVVFESVAAATAALPALVATGAATLELMDSTSLHVARRDSDAPAEIGGFEIDGHAALLIEYRGATHADLVERTATAKQVLDTLPLTRPAELTDDPAARAALWRVRKGLYATIAGNRPAGTTALLEDVVVPVSHLAETCRELEALFTTHGYEDSVIFGHAKDGNLHFMLTDDFGHHEAIERLAAFTEDMAELILRQGGNLKAEHGTGRAMAPFVERQYSPELMDVIRQIKHAFDPVGILNPGVILPDDDRAHLRDIKPVVAVEEEVDRCVECGYCEPVCPSRDLTLTPRQRIASRRAMAIAEAAGDAALVAELDREYEYAGVHTCAVDGMCQTACPVRINTGDLVKRLRREQHGRTAQKGWDIAARNWGSITGAASIALRATAALPAPVVQAPNRAARAVVGADNVPLHTPDLPSGGHRRSRIVPDPHPAPAAVFLPSCQGAMFAPAQGMGVQAALISLCRAAGVGLILPENVDSLCCGTPWSSKGYSTGFETMSARVMDSLWQATDSGRIPVIVDAASCTEGVLRILRTAHEKGDPRRIEVQDALSFTARDVLPRLPEAEPTIASLTLHPTCASTQLGLTDALLEIGRAVAERVHVPLNWGCCGFAGDRGMLHPELTASATAAEAAEVRELNSDSHASCNRACEIGMSRATGHTYSHIIELLAEMHR